MCVNPAIAAVIKENRTPGEGAVWHADRQPKGQQILRRQATAPGSVRASRQMHAPSVLMQMALKQNENQGKEKKKKIGTKEAPLALPALYLGFPIPASTLSEGHCLVEALPASRRPSSSLCLCCSCHLPLQTAAGMPRDASAYNTEHQVITTAPSCAVDSVRRLSCPPVPPSLQWGQLWGIGAAPGRWERWASLQPGVQSGGSAPRCSAPAPGRVHCGAASR